MKSSKNNSDILAAKLAEAAIGLRLPIMIATLLTVIAIAAGLPRLTFDTNYRAFFSTENPELSAFEAFQDTYTKNDNFFVVIRPADGQVFSPETIGIVEDLTEAAWQTPYASRVDSVTNFQNTYAEGDNLIVEDLVRGGAYLSDEELDRLREIAINEPLLRGQLITPDASVTAINIVMQYPEESAFEVPEAATYLRNLRDEIEADNPDISIEISGVSMLNNAFMESGINDMMTLVPLMYGVLLILVVIAIRSWSGTFATLSVIILSTLTAMGMAGYMGIGLTPVSASAPTVILTLAIADSIHILMSIRQKMREGVPKREAIIDGVRTNFLAVTITSVTTIIGFMALNLSDSPPFGHLGTMTAIGIAAAWFISVFFLPGLLSMLPMKAPRTTSNGSRVQSALEGFGGFVAAHSRVVLVVTLAASAGLASLMPRIELNDQWVNYFDQRMEVRQDNDIVLEHFGLYPIEFSVPSGTEGGISEPEYLAHLDRFADWARVQPNVTHVNSYTDVIRRLNQNLHEDDPSYFRLPESRGEAAQYLLLYELSLPYGLDLNDRINIDRSATRLTVTLANISTAETKAFFESAEAWLAANTPEYMHTQATGAPVMFAFVAERNVASMIRGNIVAVLAIGLVMALALRSLGLGLLSLIPNTLPILTTFGAWALLVGSVGFSVAAVGAVSLGIVVDDTVHFLTKFRRARTDLGYTTEEAIRYAFRTVGAAIIVNTIVLAIGFSVLAGSSFRINADLGLLTALAIVFALVLDFLLLPALLMQLSRFNSTKQPKGGSHEHLTLQPAE